MMNNNRGIALVLTLFVTVILLGFSSIFVLRSVHQSRLAEKERRMMQSFYAAEGAAQAGLNGIDMLINTYLMNTISQQNPSTVAANSSTTDGINWLVSSVRDAEGDSVLVANEEGTEAEYSDSGTIDSATYNFKVIITEKEDPGCSVGSPPCDAWNFPYNFIVQSDSSIGGQKKDIDILGDFTVQVQRDNFAKYALFTNDQTMPNGTYVWFTSSTNFDGPLHTNGRYNIYGNPSGVFDGEVSQVEQRARFYNNNNPTLINSDHNGTTDVPTFNDGFNRGADAISLSSPTQQQDMVNQVLGEDTYNSSGIYIPNNGSSVTGGIYVEGNGDVVMSVDNSGRPKYTLTQGAVTKHVTLDKDTNQTIVEVQNGSTTTYAGLPKGVDGVGTIIYVHGDITKLGGTVQGEEQVTVASSGHVSIKDHIVYENYNPAVGTPGTEGYIPPNAIDPDTGKDYKNLLGIVSWDGDIKIETQAPNNVNIHGTLLARSGIFTVTNYNSGSPRGTATMLGGVITDRYGAFGTFNGSTGSYLSGYGRNFVYDERMQGGTAPPYFPSLNTFIAFSNNITDKLVWQESDL